VSELPNKTRAWLSEPLSDEVRVSVERLVRLEDVVRVALMPDVHLADNVCVGAVVATRSCLFPDAVGGDVGCGMAAVQVGAHAGVVNRRSAGLILDAFAEVVPANRRRQKPALPAELASSKLETPALQKILERDGAVQFGTLGSGNHFLELQADERGLLWLMVHTGSRALGPALRQHHLKQAESVGGGLRVLRADSSAGQAYLNEMDGIWFCDRRTRLLVDEAPSAYKPIATVMRAQNELTRIERRLRPVLNYKGV
jgi:tRNA-splicing ligase RtcB